jgi:sigma-B regulation protein RsbU (phosphoserine phosphatase)
MLPPPFTGKEALDWHFHPSTHLGGDGLGYRRIDDDLLAIYVLDVTGHGLGSALLAVTALELLRNPVAQVDFTRPSIVIDRLNRTFQMKDHAGKFFSVWYGVYSRSKRQITYANAGHPPALLLAREGGKSRLVRTAPGGSVLGIMPEIRSPETTIKFPASSELYLFTDGLYELPDPKGGRGSYDEFFTWLEKRTRRGESPWDAMLDWHRKATERQFMDDDVTMLHFATHL